MAKLTEQAKRDIVNAFLSYTRDGLSTEHAVRICARHAIELLELDDTATQGWWLPEETLPA